MVIFDPYSQIRLKVQMVWIHLLCDGLSHLKRLKIPFISTDPVHVNQYLKAWQAIRTTKSSHLQPNKYFFCFPFSAKFEPRVYLQTFPTPAPKEPKNSTKWNLSILWVIIINIEHIIIGDLVPNIPFFEIYFHIDIPN